MKMLFFLVIFSSLCFAEEQKDERSEDTANLTSIDFVQRGEISQLVLTFDRKDIAAEKIHNKEDKQILVDLKKVKSTDRVLRPFDTSEFSGAVVFVSPYRRKEEKNVVRIALQLRDNIRSALEKRGNKIIVNLENRFGSFSEQDLSKFQEQEKMANLGQSTDVILAPKSDKIEDILENLTFSGDKKYVGKKISFNVKDINVEDLLKMIADTSGFNIILDEDVKKSAPLTLNLADISWDQALDTILNISKLSARRSGNILLVTTQVKAAAEKKLQESMMKTEQALEPLVTRIFPISYADAKDLIANLKEYATQGRGSISFDKRTNYIIVKDTVDAIERMKKIIENLDTQTPQILIEAKIVEAQEGYGKELGLANGFKVGYDPVGPLREEVGPGLSFSSISESSAGGLLGVTVSAFKRLVGLDFKLQVLESESKVKIISSPKVTTESNKTATITSKETTSYASRATTTAASGTGAEGEDQAGLVTFESTDISLSLEVTPKVTNEGAISMEVKVDKGTFGARPFAFAPPDKISSSINTNVLVDNGSTVVIGGIFSNVQTEDHSGVPFLKDLPLVGWLFRTAYNPTISKKELVIFLTPRILNQKEAGLEDVAIGEVL